MLRDKSTSKAFPSPARMIAKANARVQCSCYPGAQLLHGCIFLGCQQYYQNNLFPYCQYCKKVYKAKTFNAINTLQS